MLAILFISPIKFYLNRDKLSNIVIAIGRLDFDLNFVYVRSISDSDPIFVTSLFAYDCHWFEVHLVRGPIYFAL